MKKFLIGLLAVILTPILGAALVVATTDANQYRDQITATFGKQIGRDVSLQGPLTLGWSWHGVTLTIQNAMIGNPSWASRPTMAEIGRFNLEVALLPLLSKRLVVKRLEAIDADIQLETDINGRGNWVMHPVESESTKVPEKPEDPSHTPVALHVKGIDIRDSRLTFQDNQGHTHIFDVKKLTIGAQSAGTALLFDGIYNGTPLVLSFNTGSRDLLRSNGDGPFEADLTSANDRLKLRGNIHIDKNQIEISSYEGMATHSHFHGQLTANWGTHAAVNGTLLAERLDVSDFNSRGPMAASAPAAVSQPDNSKRLFSDAPLGLESLKSYDGDLIFKIDELLLPTSALSHVAGKIALTNGILSLSFFKARLGNGEIEAQGTINAAATPPQIAALIKAPDIRLEDMLKLLGAPDFLSGEASADINLASSGNSMHTLAENAVGVISIVAGNGKVSNSAANDIATGLMALFAPRGSNDLDCLAARFIIRNGIGRDNGILVDTGAATISGRGGFDLSREILSMDLYAKAKQINVESLMPPLRVRGTFAEPNFNIDPAETIQKVTGIFSGSSLDSGVPDIITRPGQNACLYTLDHPSAGTTATRVLPSSITGKIGAGLGVIKGFFEKQ